MTKPLEFGDLEVDDADLVVTTNSPSPQLVVVKGPAITPAVVPLPLNWVDMSNWDNDPIPEREWAIRDRVPAQSSGPVLRRRRNRKEHYGTAEKYCPCDRQGLARLNARTRPRNLRWGGRRKRRAS
jgi:hypothetical protein